MTTNQWEGRSDHMLAAKVIKLIHDRTTLLLRHALVVLLGTLHLSRINAHVYRSLTTGFPPTQHLAWLGANTTIII